MTKALVSFGLVSIPVEVHTVASSGKSCFRWVSPKGNAVSVEYVDSVTGERLERQDIRYGVEVVKDKFITLTGEEMKSLLDKRNNVIQIHEVVPRNTIPEQCVKRGYYLTPDKIQKPYRLLHQCLGERKMAAVGKWYTRGKDYLVALYPTDTTLVMLNLHYQTKLRKVSCTFAKGSEPSRKEITLANDLLDKLATTGFNAASYQDEYAQRLRAAVESKQLGHLDLATSLEKSLKGQSDEGRAKGRKGRAGSRRR